MSNYEVRKYPEKSWSISKMKVIQNCLREYYYTYYGSHNGWLYESPDESKSFQKKANHNETEKRRIKNISKAIDDMRDILDVVINV